jgi:dTDP-4-dehydrorhamnose 3,5-epimerase
MPITGVRVTNCVYIEDARGSFQKVHHSESPSGEWGRLAEVFLTESQRGVIRGMHLQWGTCSTPKFIKCIEGNVLDVLLDLRPESDTYLNIETFELSGGDPRTITMPPGIAHGYQVTSKSAMVLYGTEVNWCSKCDIGINPMSLLYEWPIQESKVSERDADLPTLKAYLLANQSSGGVWH